MKREGLLLVVSGPSGVGKGTIITQLLEQHPELDRSVSCTTRLPRPAEVDGDHYHFISVEEFASRRDAGKFLEWATVHREISYGTPREPVEEAIAQGQDIILEIDYQGARSVAADLKQRAVLVFIAPPSFAILEQRLRERPAGASDDVEKRLETAQREMQNINLFEYIIINEQAQL